jgi:hypothetical protein
MMREMMMPLSTDAPNDADLPTPSQGDDAPPWRRTLMFWRPSTAFRRVSDGRHEKASTTTHAARGHLAMMKHLRHLSSQSSCMIHRPDPCGLLCFQTKVKNRMAFGKEERWTTYSCVVPRGATCVCLCVFTTWCCHLCNNNAGPFLVHFVPGGDDGGIAHT